jgi:hypothetical protein
MEKRLIGGVFLLLSAIMGFALAAFFIIGMDWVNQFDPTGFVEDFLVVCGVMFAVFAILTLLGAVMAITGKSYGIAIVGGIFGLLTIGPYGLASIFGLIGLILVLMSKEEFEGEAPAYPPPGAYPPPAPYPPQQYPVQQPPPGQYPPQQPPPGQYPQQQPPPGQAPQQQPQAPPPTPPPTPPAAVPAEEPPAEPPKEEPEE